MAQNHVQTNVSVGFDISIAKRNAEALKELVTSLKNELREQRALMENPVNVEGYQKAEEAVKKLTLQIQTLQKVQKSATPASAYEGFISGDVQNTNTLRQAIRGAKNRMNSVPFGSGSDAEARKFLDDIDKATLKMNRLQAGFTNPLKSVKKELNDLSNGELQRLLNVLKQEQNLMRGNEQAWSNYGVAISKVEQRLREYDAAAIKASGENVMFKALGGGFRQANERELQRAIDKLKEYRTIISDPNGSGSATWEIATTEITILQSRLDGLKQKEAEARGELMSLGSALNLASKAGEEGFSATRKELEMAKKAIEDAMRTATPEEYLRLQAVLNKLTLEQQKFAGITKEVDEVLNKPHGRSLNELKMAIEQARAAMSNMKPGTKEFEVLADKVRAADREVKNLSASVRGAATAFQKAWGRLKTYIGLYVSAAAAIRKISQAFSDLMELSDKMGEVRKTTGFTADEVGRLSGELAKLDTRTGITGLMEMAAVAGQLGLKTEQEVRGFAEAANMLTVALPEMGKEGATAMLKVALATGEIDKIRQQMQDGIISGGDAVSIAMSKIGSTIDQLRANSAAAAPAITDFVKRVGAVGAQSGITIDQVAALGSTVDALGMRVEMSATALSRMIPAIKNNAFEIAKAIGVTPESIRNLFEEAGGGMQAVLMILQHIKDSGLDADGIEAMLGMGGLGDIMKDLNQQGARAGIVFAGLSQNVDELRRQLVVAHDAYEDNIAIQNEYNKMNDTTAAKWERLKNTFEEMFVTDRAQRWLGGFIDIVKWLVEAYKQLWLINTVVSTLLVYWGVLKIGLGEAVFVTLPKHLRSIARAIRGINAELLAAQKANIFTAIAFAATVAAVHIYDFFTKVNQVNKALSDAEEQFAATEREVGNLFFRLRETSIKTLEFSKNTEQLKKEESKLKSEVDALGKKLGEGAAMSEEFKKKQEELEAAHKKVTSAETASAEATNKRLGLIAEINSKYSTYLGYMLSEVSTAESVATAHDLIIASLKEEMYWREQNNAFETVRKQHEEKLGKYRGAALAEVKNLSPFEQQSIMSDWQRRLSGITYDATKGGFSIDGKTYKTLDDALGRLEKLFLGVVSAYSDREDIYANASHWWGDFVDKGFKDWTKESLKVLQETSLQQSLAGSAAQKEHENVLNEAKRNTDALIKQAQQRGSDVSNKQLAEALVGISKNFGKYSELTSQYKITGATIKSLSSSLLKDLPEATRKAIEEEAERMYAAGTTPAKPAKPENPWGKSQPASSTAYVDMTAEQLVARRKQMRDFVNSIQTDTDVEAVLKEDAALAKAFANGLAKNTRSVIEWYNTERLKIQEELYNRHLTNTGDWRDPKKGSESWRKQLKLDFDNYLKMLDAYYTERQALIQQRQNAGEITEADARRKTLENETVWRKRRIELQEIYAGRSERVAEDERRAIYQIIAEQDEDTAEMVEKTIGISLGKLKKLAEKDEVAFRKVMADLTKGMATDLKKQQSELAKYQKSVDAILRKGFDSADKAYEQFKETLDVLGIMLGGSLSDSLESFLMRVSMLGKYVKYAYKFASGEELTNEMVSGNESTYRRLTDELLALSDDKLAIVREANGEELNDTQKTMMAEIEARQSSIEAQQRDIEEFNAWIKQTTKEQQDVLLVQLQEYSENYEEAIRKIAKQQVKMSEYAYSKSDAGRDADANIKTGEANINTVKNRNELATVGNLSGTGSFGQMDALQSEVKLMDLQISRQKALIALTRQRMNAEREKIKLEIKNAETERSLLDRQLATVDKTSTEYTRLQGERALADERVRQANQSLQAQIDASNQTMQDQQTTLDELMLNRMVKIQEMDKLVMDTIGDYLSALDSFAQKSGELMGEGLWGDKEKRQEASKELLKEVATTSKKIIQQWLTNLIMKQFIAEKEVAVDQAAATASTIAKGTQDTAQLASDAARTEGQVAAGTAGAMAHEVGSKGILGVAIGAGIGLMLSALLGVVLGKINKAKSKISEITGASSGRLVTGMQTYAKGNVDAFTDPGTLQEGRSYNVDASDGRTYRARYMGRRPKTHITNGPEFHLSGESGREMIIDANTTRHIVFNEPAMMRALKTLSAGGRLTTMRRRSGVRGGVASYADGNIDEFAEMGGVNFGAGNMDDMRAALDRSSAVQEALLERLRHPIYGKFDVHGPGGLIDSYDSGKKMLNRYGEKM